MNRKTKKITGIVLSVLVICALTIPAFALTESDVQSQVSASGKEGVSGNLFVWFLCAVAFLKISQKIDSFMQGLGINVGHTGGSMLAEVMLAARGIAAARGFAGRGSGNVSRGGNNSGSGESNARRYLIENDLVSDNPSDSLPFPVFGVDGTDIGIQYRQKGLLSGTVKNEEKKQAKTSVEIADCLLNNKELPDDFTETRANEYTVYVQGEILSNL